MDRLKCLNCGTGLMLETQGMNDDDPIYMECQACGYILPPPGVDE